MNSKSKPQNSKSVHPGADTPPTWLMRPTLNAERYLSIYAALLEKFRGAREWGSRAISLMWIVVELLWFGLQVSFIVVIYQHTENIGG